MISPIILSRKANASCDHPPPDGQPSLAVGI